MKKANIYIGSNNTTHKLELDKIEQVIGNTFEGFTIYEVIGYWQHKQEKSARVEILISENQEINIVKLCKELKTILGQDAIMLEIVESNAVFI